MDINDLPEIIKPAMADLVKTYSEEKAIVALQKVLNKMSTKAVPENGVICQATIQSANIAVNVYDVDVVNNLRLAIDE